ncbi:MAG: hypothetical protein J6Q73_09075 [Bacteroidaceae bacterium]|nr:hypothetical protein [Bacteroidaceae bacterium]
MKQYIKPTSEIIDIVTTPILLSTSNNDDIYVGDKDEGVGEGGQLSNEYRSDWQNIWGNM